MILVDCDNIYIVNNKPDLDILKKRLKKIQKLDTEIIYFGNEYTANFIKKNNINIKVRVSKHTGKDSTDHELIHYGINKTKVSILTNDKTLQKLVFLLFKHIVIFHEFSDSNKIIKANVNLNLNKEMLRNIIKSHELYKSRYL